MDTTYERDETGRWFQTQGGINSRFPCFDSDNIEKGYHAGIIAGRVGYVKKVEVMKDETRED